MTDRDTGVELSILISVVDRVDDLRQLHADLLVEVEKLGVEAEFLYLVSAQFDAAFEEAQALYQRDPALVRVIRFAQTTNESATLVAGSRRARGRLVASVPAYFDTAPSGLAALLAAVRDGADLAVTIPAHARGGSSKRPGSRAVERLVSWATGEPFTNIGSGMRVMRREVLEEIPLYGEFHRFLPAMASRLGFAVRGVKAEPDGRARTPRYSLRAGFGYALDLLTLFFLSRFTHKPLRLFGGVGATFASLGGGVLAVTVVQRLLGKSLADRPALVLGVLLVGIGVQLFTIGLLGELLVFFHAREIPEYRVAAIYESPGARPLKSPPPPGGDESPGDEAGTGHGTPV